MRLIFACAMLLPMMSAAAEIKPTNDWHICQKDDDCVLVKSVCGPVAANRHYQTAVESYHQQHDSKSDCKSGNLFPHPNGVKCSFESCSAVYN